MNKRLVGKTCLVTAAAQGIGRATAIAFAEAGARVIATDINEDKLAELKTVPCIDVQKLDVTNRDAVHRLIGAVRDIGVLVNCAGYAHQGTILEASPTDWAYAHKINVESMYNTIGAVLPGMLALGHGSIVNLAAIVSSIKAAPGRFVYMTSKAAVIGLTKAVAVDFIRHGIRCNAICPGMIETPSVIQRIAGDSDPDQARRDFVARQPIGRLGRPEEVAALCVHLASDESGYTTGAVFTVDGGQSLI